ncbi:helix-turn-helix transcriptional regulator [Paraburkholderia sp. GAS42]|uniref:helix-turn-helix transcriptional regulator n=1 Tax=Paraburkholderia sp. GAS42 TaxID=3035135 RepID=UPI003D2215FD
MQAISNHADFRERFSKYDPEALIGPAEFAALIAITVSAFRQRDILGEFPPAVMRGNRCVRWRVSDVREWLRGLKPQDKRHVAKVDVNGTPKPRRGRKRQSAELMA